jgi:hypothetical protein
MQFSALLTLLTVALLSTLVPAAPTGASSSKTIADLFDIALAAQYQFFVARLKAKSQADLDAAEEAFRQVLTTLKPALETHTETLETLSGELSEATKVHDALYVFNVMKDAGAEDVVLRPLWDNFVAARKAAPETVRLRLAGIHWTPADVPRAWPGFFRSFLHA